jgi:hypothetical protein
MASLCRGHFRVRELIYVYFIYKFVSMVKYIGKICYT